MKPAPEEPVTSPEDEERAFHRSLHELYAKEGRKKIRRTRWLLAVSLASGAIASLIMLFLPYPWSRVSFFFAVTSLGLMRLLDEQWMGTRRIYTLAILLSFVASFGIRCIVLPLVGNRVQQPRHQKENRGDSQRTNHQKPSGEIRPPIAGSR